MNVSLALNYGEKILSNKLIPNPHLDSEILLAKTINKDRKYLLLNSEKKLKKVDFIIFDKLIKKRSIGKPIAYLTNNKFFWNSEFIVSKDTLIPRPDTELIVESVLKLTKSKNKINILDVGVGTGCILLSILNEKNFYGTVLILAKNV